MKIYVVTQGEYSDYHIITATTDKSLAEKIVKKFERDYYRKPDIEVYENAEVYLKPCWDIWFNRDGSVFRVYDETNSDYYYHEIGNVKRVYAGRGMFHVVVSADNETAAIKIAAERRAKFLAEEEGL